MAIDVDPEPDWAETMTMAQAAVDLLEADPEAMEIVRQKLAALDERLGRNVPPPQGGDMDRESGVAAGARR